MLIDLKDPYSYIHVARETRRMLRWPTKIFKDFYNRMGCNFYMGTMSLKSKYNQFVVTPISAFF